MNNNCNIKRNIKNRKKLNSNKFKNRLNMFIFVIFIVFIFSILSNVSFGKNELKTKQVIVSSNDTIWNISKDICNSSDKSLNIQNVVNKIKKINNLNSSDIYVGQVLTVPIY